MKVRRDWEHTKKTWGETLNMIRKVRAIAAAGKRCEFSSPGESPWVRDFRMAPLRELIITISMWVIQSPLSVKEVRK